jgi:hypothetical protein
MFLRRPAGCAPGNSARVNNGQRARSREPLFREIAWSVIELLQLKSVEHGLVNLLAVLSMLADGAMIFSKKPIKHSHRVIQVGVETGPKMPQVLRIDFETETFRFFDEPMECFVRKPVR